MDKPYSFKDEINRVLFEMKYMDPDSEEYLKTAQALKILCEAQSKKSAFLIDPEIVLMVAANLVSVALILNHERLHVVSTKALQFIKR